MDQKYPDRLKDFDVSRKAFNITEERLHSVCLWAIRNE